MPPLKITVATVTYNAEALIERTIRSVEEQTYPHVEHLIVDGNSQDETLTHITTTRNATRSPPCATRLRASASPTRGSTMP